MLAWIMCGTGQHGEYSKRTNATITLESITGSSEVVTILNRLGHGLSYSKIEEFETAMTEEEQLAKHSECMFLPTHAKKKFQVYFAGTITTPKRKRIRAKERHIA